MLQEGSSFIPTITRLIDGVINRGEGASNMDEVITVLSLLCIISIFNKGQGFSSVMQTSVANAGTNATSTQNQLGKILGDLTKGDGGGLGPDTLMSLMPLLNNPQLKSKINPATISSILGMVNSMNAGSNNDNKQDGSKEKSADDKANLRNVPNEKQTAPAKEEKNLVEDDADVADITYKQQATLNEDENEISDQSKYLNWKTNF